jgi:hypothetical protein
MQLDPMVLVAVYAGRLDEANALVAKRLATPGLSFEQKAYTYMAAVQSFLEPRTSTLLPTAERYLQALDAMGDSAAYWQFRARVPLVQIYYGMGQSRLVAQHGSRAIVLSGIMRYQDRVVMFPDAPVDPLYLITMEAVSGQSGGRARVEELNAVLKAAATTVPPGDATYREIRGLYERKLAEYLKTGAMLGKPAQPLIASYWINRASSDSATLLLNDGKIRLVEVSDHGCAPCIGAMYGMQRVQKRYPNIEPVFTTVTFGYWGNRFVEPDEETTLLIDYFRTTLKDVRFPIGILKRTKVHNEEGGWAPGSSGINYDNYPGIVKPTIWLVDGKGVVRNVFSGFGHDVEEQMARSIAFLQQEADLKAGADPSSPSTVPAAL